MIGPVWGEASDWPLIPHCRFDVQDLMFIVEAAKMTYEAFVLSLIPYSRFVQDFMLIGEGAKITLWQVLIDPWFLTLDCPRFHVYRSGTLLVGDQHILGVCGSTLQQRVLNLRMLLTTIQWNHSCSKKRQAIWEINAQSLGLLTKVGHFGYYYTISRVGRFWWVANQMFKIQ